MRMFVVAGILGLYCVVALWPLSVALANATWPRRAPRTAVLLWQAVGVSALLAGIGAGLCVAVERFHAGFSGGVALVWSGLLHGHMLHTLGLPDTLGLTLATDLAVVLGSMLVFATFTTTRMRARHRQLVDLLAPDTLAAGAHVVEHPDAVAYCVPGLRPRIVISTGTVALLSDSELDAVLQHERGHAIERHGLVMLAMVGIEKVLGWIPYAAHAPREVAGLLEMAADDHAARTVDPSSLASALVSMATAGSTPACLLGFAAVSVTERVQRLLSPSRSSRHVAMAACVGALALLGLPVALLAALGG